VTSNQFKVIEFRRLPPTRAPVFFAACPAGTPPSHLRRSPSPAALRHPPPTPNRIAVPRTTGGGDSRWRPKANYELIGARGIYKFKRNFYIYILRHIYNVIRRTPKTI